VPQYQVFPSFENDQSVPIDAPNATPAQLFDLYEQMPDDATVDSLGITALTPLRHWVEAHPDIGKSWPPTELIDELVANAYVGAAHRLALPMTRTYRIALSLPQIAQRIFYARTADRASSVAIGRRRAPSPGTQWSGDSYIGVQLLTTMSESLEELPDTFNYKLRAGQPWQVGWARTEAGTWPASIDPWNFYLKFHRTAAADSAYDAVSNDFDAGWNTDALPLFDGAFVPTSDGQFVYRWRLALGSGKEMVIEATRISGETFALNR
jgi:hypothetical protein